MYVVRDRDISVSPHPDTYCVKQYLLTYYLYARSPRPSRRCMNGCPGTFSLSFTKQGNGGLKTDPNQVIRGATGENPSTCPDEYRVRLFTSLCESVSNLCSLLMYFF